jgi:hypothetical protein
VRPKISQRQNQNPPKKQTTQKPQSFKENLKRGFGGQEEEAEEESRKQNKEAKYKNASTTRTTGGFRENSLSLSWKPYPKKKQHGKKNQKKSIRAPRNLQQNSHAKDATSLWKVQQTVACASDCRAVMDFEATTTTNTSCSKP